MVHRDDLSPVDQDFVHLFSSWFNRGFLVLRRIDWSTPAIVLEKIIRYEAVHQIRDWDDLRRRIDPPDRRCYAFFHPALNDEPLIFVEVAFTDGIPRAIAPILGKDGNTLAPERANTAVFYSISNCQRGLSGVSFGSFLIKQVVEEVSREFPRLSNFVTLSPVPGFASWLARERTSNNPILLPEDLAALSELDKPDWWQDGAAERLQGAAAACGRDLFPERTQPQRRALDPVARFHLGNGARLEQLNVLADLSEKGLAQSHGLMVNYLYDVDEIEKNHEAYRGRPHHRGGARHPQARTGAEGVGEGVALALTAERASAASEARRSCEDCGHGFGLAAARAPDDELLPNLPQNLRRVLPQPRRRILRRHRLAVEHDRRAHAGDRARLSRHRSSDRSACRDASLAGPRTPDRDR